MLKLVSTCVDKLHNKLLEQLIKVYSLIL